MKVYRQNRSGFVEELNTDGSYKPVGWSTTKAAARRKGNRQAKNLKE